MIIWRGHGIMVLVLMALGYGGTVGLVGVLADDFGFYKKHAWVEAVGMLIAAGLIYLFDFLLRREAKPKVVIEKDTGKEITLTQRHDFFFIPFKAWTYVCIGLALLFFYQRWN